MPLTRRHLLRILALCCSPALIRRVLASDLPRFPDPTTFESGDLLWPKLPGAFTPYGSASLNDSETDEQDWIRERDAFLDKIKNDDSARALIRELSELSYKQFYLRYARDQDLAAIAPYGAGTFA